MICRLPVAVRKRDFLSVFLRMTDLRKNVHTYSWETVNGVQTRLLKVDGCNKDGRSADISHAKTRATSLPADKRLVLIIPGSFFSQRICYLYHPSIGIGKNLLLFFCDRKSRPHRVLSGICSALVGESRTLCPRLGYCTRRAYFS